jgi:surface antigen
MGIRGFSVARSVLAYGSQSATLACLKAACGFAAALSLAACSLTSPFESGRSSALQADPDITGSISPAPSRANSLSPGQISLFSPKLDEEDWRRAKAALATALDPQGNGAQVGWDNGESGAKGSFAPIGNAFLAKDDICRAFVAAVSVKEPERWFQGTACRVTPAEWQIKDVKPWKKLG